MVASTRTRKALAAESVGRADTRDRILDAARGLMLGRAPGNFSVAEVAARAGVTHRTVYRYFADRQALVVAVAERPTDVAADLVWPERYDRAREGLRAFWRFFGEHLDDLRTERLVPGGLELRRARLVRGREMARALLRDAGVPDGPTLEDLIEVVVLLTSSGTLLDLVDRHGLNVDAAVDLVMDAVDRLVRSARSEVTE